METIKKGVFGSWKDVYTFQDGTTKETQWKRNQIQLSYGTISARMFKETISGEESSLSGFQFLALGQGDSDWDLAPAEKDTEQTTLLDEIDRIEIDPETNIVYLNPETFAVSASPTNLLEITILIGVGDGIGSLREFGLFCGNATSTADSGYMFNWVSHALIEKDLTNPFTILRTIRIHWSV